MQAVAKLKTKDINGVEIFAVGTHNGIEYTEADLDDIVEAYASLSEGIGYDPPVKLDHDEDQPSPFDDVSEPDGGPAFGWLANVRRDGAKLLADFKKVPAKLADLIDAGAYRGRSAEVWHNIKIDGTTYRRALKAVALLGVKMPAVKNLKDIIKLYNDDPRLATFGEDERGRVQAALYYSESPTSSSGGIAVGRGAQESPAASFGDADEEADLTTEELEEILGSLSRRLDRQMKNKTGAPTTRAFLNDLKKRLMNHLGKTRKNGADVPANEYQTLLFKTEVNYRTTTDTAARCVDCRWFNSWGSGPGNCSLVEGLILAEDTCDRQEATPPGRVSRYNGTDGDKQPETGKEEAEMAEKEFEEFKAKVEADYTAKFTEMTGKLDEALGAVNKYAEENTVLRGEVATLGEKAKRYEADALTAWASNVSGKWVGDHETNRERLLEYVGLVGDKDDERVRKFITREDEIATQVRSSKLFTEAGAAGHDSTTSGFDAIVAKYTAEGKSGAEAIKLAAAEAPALYREHSLKIAGRSSDASGDQ